MHREQVSGKELRQILDMYLRSVPTREIAAKFHRTESAIDSLLNKISRDYTEDGKRTSLIEKLVGEGTILRADRENFSYNEIRFFKLCLRQGRSLGQMMIIFILQPKRVVELERRASGGMLRSGRMQKEYEAKGLKHEN